MLTTQRFRRLATIGATIAIALAATNNASAVQTDVPNATPTQMVDALNGVFGKHKARAVHAKGVVLEGTFTPSASAASISKARHFQKSSVPVTVRFSDFAGIPDIPDNHGLGSPRGMAIKFQLQGNEETDIVAHSFNGFPSATTDDFRDLLIALGTSGPDTQKPTPLDAYLGSHQVAKAFLTAPKPAPVSFASLPYFGVNAFKFVNAKGIATVGRYQLIPVGGAHYLTPEQSAKAAHDYLSDEIREHVNHQGPVKFKLVLQIAEQGDAVDDPSVAWPDSRRKLELGTITVAKVVVDKAAETKLMFSPGVLPAGIEVQDPMVNARSAAYPVSFARRQ